MHLATFQEKVAIPQGASVTVDGLFVHVKGPKGELSRRLGTGTCAIAVQGETVTLSAVKVTKNIKRNLRTSAAHLRNMLAGVTRGFVYRLRVCSGHFPMSVSVKGDTLEVKNFIGEAVPRVLKLSHGCKVKLEGHEITVEGVDKERCGNQAADIELLTRRPGFDTRIFQDGIYIIEKDGKAV